MADGNIEDNIKLLQKKFLQIRDIEYVKSVRRGNTGIVATFESLLNKEEDSFEIPDFGGIEIKTRESYSKAYIGLFNAVPTGGSFYEVKRLRDTYGYRDSKERNLKCLHVEVVGKEMTMIGGSYFFRLRVDPNEEKLYLQIFDKNRILIDESTYWDFDTLREKLLRKLKVLAVVKAWPNRIGVVEYFKYYKMNIYILRGFPEFLNLLEDGKIMILFRIGNYYDEKRYGQVHSHGVGFCIKEENLLDLFDLYR